MEHLIERSERKNKNALVHGPLSWYGELASYKVLIGGDKYKINHLKNTTVVLR